MSFGYSMHIRLLSLVPPMHLGADFRIGTLPPPSALVSLPVSFEATPTWVNSLQRIQSGQFIEMRDILADNITMLNQLTSQWYLCSPSFYHKSHKAEKSTLVGIMAILFQHLCGSAYIRPTDS